MSKIICRVSCQYLKIDVINGSRFPQINEAAQLLLTLIVKSVTRAAAQHIRMISEGSSD